MGRPRTGLPVKFDQELGLTLYGPTATNPAYRLDYLDPFTGARKQPRRTLEADAFALWDETAEYLRYARLAAPLPNGTRTSAGPTVDDLFEKRLERWVDDECAPHYIETRVGRYDYRLRPVFGDWTVRDWAATSEGCREVLRSARVQGLAPSTVQDLGALMRTMVSLAWELRWIPPGHNPMLGVKYTKGSTDQGQGPEFVRESDRPEFSKVEQLVAAYEELADETGLHWLPVRTLVGAYGGLRPSERDALRVCDVRADDLAVRVEHAISWEKGKGPVRRPPKNGKVRDVLLPVPTVERLVHLVEQRRAAGCADDALLFEDPERPGMPISESATRRFHIEAALRAKWETVEVRRHEDSRRHLGPDKRPRHTNYSLRHHAAVWMHEVGHYDWADVSRYLGHHSVSFTHAVYVRSGAEADERNRARLRALAGVQ
jgi:integrase